MVVRRILDCMMGAESGLELKLELVVLGVSNVEEQVLV
jgi:hypothetical protein